VCGSCLSRRRSLLTVAVRGQRATSTATWRLPEGRRDHRNPCRPFGWKELRRSCQYRLGRRVAASVGKQFYCAAEASVVWTLAVPGVVCGSARCRVTAAHPHLPAAGRQVTRRYAAAQNKKPRGEAVAIHQRRNRPARMIFQLFDVPVERRLRAAFAGNADGLRLTAVLVGRVHRIAAGTQLGQHERAERSGCSTSL
jgi:hypothetical protein